MASLFIGDEHRAWLAGLKAGDEVRVTNVIEGDRIMVVVRRTPSGMFVLSDGHRYQRDGSRKRTFGFGGWYFIEPKKQKVAAT